jgi:hypothetical protein
MATILGLVAFERPYATSYLGCKYLFALLQYKEGYCFVSSLKEEYCVRIATKFVLMKKICYGVVAKFKMRFNK